MSGWVLLFRFWLSTEPSLGSLDGLKTDEQRASAEAFYGKVAAIAKANGVSVSVLSIAGTECRLENLGMVADVTGGAVRHFMSPLSLSFFPFHLCDKLLSSWTYLQSSTSLRFVVLHTSLSFARCLCCLLVRLCR